MKKKMVCILMAGVMASLVPAQMVFAEGDSGEKTVVKFQTWNPGDEEYTHAMLEKFEEEHPDIQIDYTFISMRAGEHMSYHMHNYREEVWTVVSGKGKAIVDGMEQVLRTGDVITIAAGCKHTVEAITALDMIEVQLGEEISVTDKIKFPME